MKIISLCLLRIFITATMLLLTELQDQEYATRTGVQDQNQIHPQAVRIHYGRKG